MNDARFLKEVDEKCLSRTDLQVGFAADELLLIPVPTGSCSFDINANAVAGGGDEAFIFFSWVVVATVVLCFLLDPAAFSSIPFSLPVASRFRLGLKNDVIIL
jgi:hypothetical protein